MFCKGKSWHSCGRSSSFSALGGGRGAFFAKNLDNGMRGVHIFKKTLTTVWEVFDFLGFRAFLLTKIYVSILPGSMCLFSIHLTRNFVCYLPGSMCLFYHGWALGLECPPPEISRAHSIYIRNVSKSSKMRWIRLFFVDSASFKCLLHACQSRLWLRKAFSLILLHESVEPRRALDRVFLRMDLGP